jgi:flagellar hook-associated protein 2
MAVLSSPGVGSGLDINGLVEKLVAAERAPQQAQITRAQTSTVTTISALGSLKGSLGAFQSALTPLSTLSSITSRSAVSSDPDTFTATAASSAAPGSYDIEVLSVASAHQISSRGFPGGSTQVIGTGTLTVGVGTKNFQIAIPDTANTLAGIRDAINSATGNDNLVRATIVNGTDGAHLVLSSQTTGATNTISIAAAGGDGGLAPLAFSTGVTNQYTQPRAAADSQVSVAGNLQTSSSATITTAIDGVTLNLLKADIGETHHLTIANDTAAVTSRIKKFVDEFNSLGKQFANLRSYDPATKKAGPLLGDSFLRTVEGEVRGKLTDRVSGLSGTYQSLASIGITTAKDGTLTLDDTKLQAALSADYNGVAAIFGSTNGVAARLNAVIEPRLAKDAELDVRSKQLNAKSVDLQKDLTALDTRMAKVEARYRAQFNALDSLLSKLQSSSTFLSQQLDSISKISSGK